MKKGFIISFLLLLTVLCHSQVEERQRLIDELETVTSDTARIRITKTLMIAFGATDFELSRKYAEKCLSLALETGDRESEASASSALGSYYINKDNYTEATVYSLRALRIYKELDNKRWIAVIYNNLGLINLKQGNFEEARVNLKEAIKLRQEIGAERSLANSYQLLASVYVSEKDYGQALVYYEKGLQSARKSGDGRVESACLNGIGIIHFKKKDFGESARVYNQVLELLQRSPGDNRKAICGAYHNIAQAYRKLGKYDESLELLNKSLALAKEIGSNEDIKQAYAALSTVYKERGDLRAALTAQEYYSVYKDSVLNEKTRKTINGLQEKYKVEERKKEIADLRQKNDQLEEKSTLQYSLLVVSAGGFLIALLAVFFYIKHHRAKQQRKQAQLEQKALRVQMNPHFIFNGLNSIQRMYIEGKEDIANDYMADFSKLLRSILENSGREVIRLKEELEVVQLYMDLEMIRTDHSFDYVCELDETINPLLVRIPPLIFQPYLENAIWHGIISKKEKGTIRLSIKKSGPGKLICQVTDNGVGFYSGQKQKSTVSRKSLGMKITAERLGGEENVLVEELDTGGTRITIKLEYTI